MALSFLYCGYKGYDSSYHFGIIVQIVIYQLAAQSK